MTLISPLCLFTHTKVRWKRLCAATEPASAVELTRRTRRPTPITHHLPFPFIFIPLLLSAAARFPSALRTHTLKPDRLDAWRPSNGGSRGAPGTAQFDQLGQLEGPARASNEGSAGQRAVRDPQHPDPRQEHVSHRGEADRKDRDEHESASGHESHCWAKHEADAEGEPNVKEGPREARRPQTRKPDCHPGGQQSRAGEEAEQEDVLGHSLTVCRISGPNQPGTASSARPIVRNLVPLPVAAGEPLDDAERDHRASAVDRRPLLLPAVEANAVADLLELLRVGIGGRLAPVPNRLGLPPVLVLFDPLLKLACACCVHGLPDRRDGSAT